MILAYFTDALIAPGSAAGPVALSSFALAQIFRVPDDDNGFFIVGREGEYIVHRVRLICSSLQNGSQGRGLGTMRYMTELSKDEPEKA